MPSAKCFSRTAGKGDGNIRYYEYEGDNLYALDEHKSSDPQRGMCFVPRRAINTSECEIARGYKLTTNAIEPIAFIVPRKVSFPFPSRDDTTDSERAHKVGLFPIGHLPASALNRALPHSRRILLGQSRLSQTSLSRNGRSFRRGLSVFHFPPKLGLRACAGTRTRTNTLFDGTVATVAQTPSLSPIIAPPLTKVASEPPSTSVSVPLTPADVQIPPSCSAPTYISDVCSLLRSWTKLLVDINDIDCI